MVLGTKLKKNQNERIMFKIDKRVDFLLLIIPNCYRNYHTKFEIDKAIITLTIRAIRYGRTHLTVQTILF